MQIASDDLWYQEHVRSIAISEMLPVPSKQTIYHDSANPSHLLLPVIPDAPIIKPVEPPVSEIHSPVNSTCILIIFQLYSFYCNLFCPASHVMHGPPEGLKTSITSFSFAVTVRSSYCYCTLRIPTVHYTLSSRSWINQQ